MSRKCKHSQVTPAATIVNAAQTFTLIQLVVKRTDRTHLSWASSLTHVFVLQRLRGQAIMAEGLRVTFTHHKPYFLVIIHIVIGETFNSPYGHLSGNTHATRQANKEVITSM